MNKTLMVLALAAIFAAPVFAEDAAKFKDRKDEDSYAIGAQTGRNLKKDAVDVNIDQLVRGIKDALNGDKMQLTEKELRAVMSRVQQDIHKTMVINRRAASERNKEEAAKYLAENGRKEGVVTTASGLQYKILKQGTGNKPFLNSTVLVNYRGSLLNGVEFDASPDGKPAQMVVIQTVTGFKEALQLMSVGSHWQLAMPANLAYGDRGTGVDIGPNQALLFDVELVEIKEGIPAKPDAAKPAVTKP